MLVNASDYVLAAGGLGTAAFALVDAMKALPGGGVSKFGFSQIVRAVSKLYLQGAGSQDAHNPLSLAGVLATLRANWLNGTALSDQKAIAKTLIKLRLDKANAAVLAAATGVDAATLTSVAAKIATGQSLSQQETDVFGRFDLILATLLDEGYERADQIYRNGAKALAIPISVLLAFVGGWTVSQLSWGDYLSSNDLWAALLTGIVATPLAPISKDLATRIASAVRAAGFLRK